MLEDQWKDASMQSFTDLESILPSQSCYRYPPSPRLACNGLSNEVYHRPSPPVACCPGDPMSGPGKALRHGADSAVVIWDEKMLVVSKHQGTFRSCLVITSTSHGS